MTQLETFLTSDFNNCLNLRHPNDHFTTGNRRYPRTCLLLPREERRPPVSGQRRPPKQTARWWRPPVSGQRRPLKQTGARWWRPTQRARGRRRPTWSTGRSTTPAPLKRSFRGSSAWTARRETGKMFTGSFRPESGRIIQRCSGSLAYDTADPDPLICTLDYKYWSCSFWRWLSRC